MTELSGEDEALIQNKKNLLVDNNNNPIPPAKKDYKYDAPQKL